MSNNNPKFSSHYSNGKVDNDFTSIEETKGNIGRVGIDQFNRPKYRQDSYGGTDGLDSINSLPPVPRPPSKPNVLVDDETVCPVCGETAPDDDKHHLHYGGICCYSCRAFFRRCHQGTKTPKFECRNGNTGKRCPITMKTRRKCQKCRYDRCLEIGMESKWVLTGDQKKVRFRNLLGKRKRLEMNRPQPESSQEPDFTDQTRFPAAPPEPVVSSRNTASTSSIPFGHEPILPQQQCELMDSLLKQRALQQQRRAFEQHQHHLQTLMFHQQRAYLNGSVGEFNRLSSALINSQQEATRSEQNRLCSLTDSSYQAQRLYNKYLPCNPQWGLAMNNKYFPTNPHQQRFPAFTKGPSEPVVVVKKEVLDVYPDDTYSDATSDQSQKRNILKDDEDAAKRCKTEHTLPGTEMEILQSMKANKGITASPESNRSAQNEAEIENAELSQLFRDMFSEVDFSVSMTDRLVSNKGDVAADNNTPANSPEHPASSAECPESEVGDVSVSMRARIETIILGYNSCCSKFKTSIQFVKKLVSLHNLSEANLQELVNFVAKDSTKPKQPLDEHKTFAHLLVDHFSNLLASLESFISSQFVFRSLPVEDRQELLARNGQICIQYILARYLSADVAVEQLQWLLNFHISLPMWAELQVLHSLKPDEFVEHLKPLVDCQMKLAEYTAFKKAVAIIGKCFQYPFFYTGLLANLFFFYSDNTYQLTNPQRVKRIYAENLAIVRAGYETIYQDVGLSNVHALIKTLLINSKLFSRLTDRNLKESISSPTVIPYRYTTDEEFCLKDRLEMFQGAYYKQSPGDYLIELFIDITVHKKPIPHHLMPSAISLCIERFKRVIHLHEEYNELGPVDKLQLWKNNFAMAVALNIIKMETAQSPKDQLRYLMGHLKRGNEWEMDFKHICDLNELEFLGMNRVNCDRFGETEMEIYKQTIDYVGPVIRDDVSFQILVMIILLDTDLAVTPDIPAKVPLKFMKPRLREMQNAQTRLMKVTSLQKQYINLLHRRGESLGGEDKVRELTTDPYGIRRIAEHGREIAVHLVPYLMR